MMKTRWLGATLFLMGLVMPLTSAHGQDGKVQWKALEGKTPFFQELTTTTEQTMTVMGQTNKQKQTQTFVFKWTPKGKADDVYEVEQEIVSIKMDIDIGGNKISYDSGATNQPKNPMTEFFGALKGAKFTVYLKPSEQKVTKVEGVTELVDSLTKINAQMKPLLEQILSEPAVKQMAEPMLTVVPPKGEFKDGMDTWPSTSKLDMGPIGTYETKNTYAFNGFDKDKNLAKIGVKVDLTYVPPGAKDKAKLPFTITEAKLSGKQDDAKKSEIVFNVEKGLIESSTIYVNLNGDITIEIAGMQTSVGLVQTQETKLKTMDKAPE